VGLAIGGLFLAPITAGISLGLTASGITASVLGAGTNVGTEIAKRKLLNGLRDRAKDLLEKRAVYREKTFLYVTRIIMNLMKEIGDDKG